MISKGISKEAYKQIKRNAPLPPYSEAEWRNSHGSKLDYNTLITLLRISANHASETS